ncbi:MAG TPA: hypothetical protein VEJ67_00575 [Candidatus Cybelea sp.]|nr:hypothetical protein [Candidatus Cybelea sp.]
MTYAEAAKTAIECQDACNLSGVVFSFAEAMRAVCDEAQRRGGNFMEKQAPDHSLILAQTERSSRHTHVRRGLGVVRGSRDRGKRRSCTGNELKIFATLFLTWVIAIALILAQPANDVERRRWAASQDGDGFVFRATGLRGRTFRMKEPADDDNSCAAFLENATADELKVELLERGFTTVACEEISVQLPTNMRVRARGSSRAAWFRFPKGRRHSSRKKSAK